MIIDLFVRLSVASPCNTFELIIHYVSQRMQHETFRVSKGEAVEEFVFLAYTTLSTMH